MSPISPIAVFAIAILAATTSFGHGLSAQKPYADPLLGIKIKPPSKWAYLGTYGDRGALRALYASPRAYASNSQEGLVHTPTMRVLWFPKAAKGSKATNSDKLATKWPLRTPFTDHQDYLERVYPGLERIAYDVGPIGVGKLPGRRYVMANKSSGGVSLHLATVKLDDGEFAIEYECLTEQHKKLAPTFNKSLTTLTTMPRQPPPAAAAPPKWQTDYEGWRLLAKADRNQQRLAWGKQWLTNRRKQPEPGWKPYQNKDYLILSRADRKFTKRALKALDRIRPWVDARLAKVSDATVMPAVVRIFADRRERTAYRVRDLNVLDYEPRVREIWFYKDAAVGNTGGGFSALIRGVFFQVLHDKHPLVKDNLPRWLDSGLQWYMETSKLKGKKLTFPASDIEMGRFKYHQEHESLEPLWGFIQEKSAPTPAGGENEPPWGFTPECVRLVRWFWEAAGGKHLNMDDFLAQYLGRIGTTAAKFDADLGARVDQRFLNESKLKELNQIVYARRDKFLQQINYTLIPLSGDAWARADAAFKEYVANFKL